MNTTPAKSVTIGTVSYNSTGVIGDMLASVPAMAQAVVVDNGSEDIAELRALCETHGATLIENERNHGFGAACNQAVAGAETEFLLFLNPDAVLEEGCLEALIDAAATNPNAVAFNPKILDPNGAAAFKRHSYLLPKSKRLKRGVPAEAHEVPILSGAAFFVRRADFEAVGGFDPAIFLYHEDDDLGVRLANERGALMFIPEAVVQHLGGRSSVRSPQIAALKAWHMGRSRVYTTTKHGRPLPFFTALHSALRQLFSVAVLFSPRKRAKQWALFTGVLSTLKDGGKAKGPI